MNLPTDRRPLLDAVLDETLPRDFREAALHQTLRAAHRRKRLRTARGVLLTVVGMAILAFFLKPGLLLERRAVRHPFPPLTIISSLPFNPSLIAATRPGAVDTIHSSPTSVVMVNTVPMQDRLNLLSDNQLLALLADYGAVLVRDHPTDPIRLVLTTASAHAPALE